MKDTNYTDEFKANTIRMVLVEGLTRTEVGRRLATALQNMSLWVKEHQENQQNSGSDRENNALLKKKKHNLQVKQKLRYKNTTHSAHDLKVRDNLLGRKFNPDIINQVWTNAQFELKKQVSL